MAPARASFLVSMALLCLSLLTASTSHMSLRTAVFPGEESRVIHVPGDYPSIQEAVDAAPAYSTIIVGPGVYHEAVVIDGKPGLRITGVGGPVVENRDTVLLVRNSSGVVIKDIYVRRGSREASYRPLIYVERAEAVLLNVSIEAPGGGVIGLYVGEEAAATVDGCFFKNAGMLVDEDAAGAVVNNTVFNGSILYPAGVDVIPRISVWNTSVNDKPLVYIKDYTGAPLSIGDVGEAVIYASSNITVSVNASGIATMYTGRGLGGAAVIVASSQNITIRGPGIRGISASRFSAAVAVYSSRHVVIRDLSIESVGDSVLAAVYVEDSSNIRIHNVSIEITGHMPGYAFFFNNTRDAAITRSEIYFRGPAAGAPFHALNSSNIYMYLCNIGGRASAPIIRSSTAAAHSPRPLRYMYGGRLHEGFLGNHWEGYMGVDEDGDGVIDEPYTYTVFLVDAFPLAGEPVKYDVIGSGSRGSMVLAAIGLPRPANEQYHGENRPLFLMVYNPFNETRRYRLAVHAPGDIEAYIAGRSVSGTGGIVSGTGWVEDEAPPLGSRYYIVSFKPRGGVARGTYRITVELYDEEAGEKTTKTYIVEIWAGEEQQPPWERMLWAAAAAAAVVAAVTVFVLYKRLLGR